MVLDRAALVLWDAPLHRARSWPVTRLASWSLTLALALSVLVPAAAGRPESSGWLLLAAPTVAITIVVRALFEVLGTGREPHGIPRRVGVALVPALAATGLGAVACRLVGVDWAGPAAALTLVMAAVTLTAAGVLRQLEIDFRQRMRRVYFVGSPAWLRDIGAELARHGDRQLVGYESLGEGTGPVDVDSVVADVLRAHTTVLVVDIDAVGFPAVVELAESLGGTGIEVNDLVSYYEQEFKKIPLSELASDWLRFEEPPARSGLPRSRVYRAFELALSGAVLLVCLPALIALGLAIGLTSRGPVLYRQRRVGRDGRPFTLLKLRTMSASSERTASWAPSQAHRVTWLGRPLRRFRIDELPQLWNVLRGDLALVGPRPEQIPIVEMLERRLPHYGVRHCIRPGITGWAQVNVAYGGSVEGALAKLQADLYYVKHASVRLDALIIWLTVKAVLAGRGR